MNVVSSAVTPPRWTQDGAPPPAAYPAKGFGKETCHAEQTFEFPWGPALAILVVALFGGPVFGHGAAMARTLDGVWDVTVTVVDCATGQPPVINPPPPFRAIITFTREGKVIESAGSPLVPSDTPPPPPTFFVRSSPGLGTWSHAGGRMYSAYRFFRLNNNSYAGVQVIGEEIELHGDTFAAEARPSRSMPVAP